MRKGLKICKTFRLANLSLNRKGARTQRCARKSFAYLCVLAPLRLSERFANNKIIEYLFLEIYQYFLIPYFLFSSVSHKTIFVNQKFFFCLEIINYLVQFVFVNSMEMMK